MPISEFKCRDCDHYSNFFTRSMSQAVEPTCGNCKSEQMDRIFSPFAHHRSAQSLHAESGSSGFDYYRDPRNIGRNVEDTFKRAGMDMPSQVKEKIDAARHGDVPKEVSI